MFRLKNFFVTKDNRIDIFERGETHRERAREGEKERGKEGEGEGEMKVTQFSTCAKWTDVNVCYQKART